MGLWRFVIAPRKGQADPVGTNALQMLRDFGATTAQEVRSARLFTIEVIIPNHTINERTLTERIANELLTDPVNEECQILAPTDSMAVPGDTLGIEVHFKPGVMDQVADSATVALRDMGIETASVRSARRYEVFPRPNAEDTARIARLLGNDCVEEVVVGGKPIEPPPHPPAYEFRLRHVAIRELDDAGLEQLSRQGHLFLSLEEMQTIQKHFRQVGRDPSDLELETLAQTWSEHCVHKTLTANIEYSGESFPGSSSAEVGSGFAPFRRVYSNLLRETIAKATHELIAEGRGPTCWSVFKDNAGVIAFDDEYGIAFKVETHNHPSAIEPYGGSATGIGGVIRDVIGCGLGAKPIANTDVFCVAPPDWPVDSVPRGVIHPRSVLKGIVSGVRDYGNRMGIPTINGAVYFDPRYLGNPLVYCGCIGLIPKDRIEKAARPGDVIVLLGGRTGRDGIHGATFSSAELTDTHVDEFAHAVQIGNAIEEKKVLDVILQARDFPVEAGSSTPSTRCLYSAITDCGAGGLSSAIGEMGAAIGAEVDLEMVPLKYSGLRYDEIWISEAQERMVLAVPPENVELVLNLAQGENVEATAIGRFTDTGRLVVRYQGIQAGDLDMHFLHDGVPKSRKQAEWQAPPRATSPAAPPSSPVIKTQGILETLKEHLADPNIASKHWIVRQYDHEVQARSVVKPLIGDRHGPSDASVIRPRLNSRRGLAVGCGLSPALADEDPYWMAVAAIDEAVRNVVAVGGDPARAAILDNFCWPRVDDARSLGALVRACQACYDAAKAYGLPFISGKDSLNNEFAMNESDAARLHELMASRWPHLEGARRGTRLAIPYTLLISAIALIDDVFTCTTMDLKRDGSSLYLFGRPSVFRDHDPLGRPAFDFTQAVKTHQVLSRLVRERAVNAVHDVSDGGWLVACAEMALASGLSCTVQLTSIAGQGDSCATLAQCCFEPMPALYLVEVTSDRLAEFERSVAGVPVRRIGRVDRPAAGQAAAFSIEVTDSTSALSVPAVELERIWKAPLDW